MKSKLEKMVHRLLGPALCVWGGAPSWLAVVEYDVIVEFFNTDKWSKSRLGRGSHVHPMAYSIDRSNTWMGIPFKNS